MGNEAASSYAQVEHSLNHPRMKQVRFTKNNEVMTATMSVEDENQFFNWENRLAKLKKFDQYYLLLPKAYQFSKKGVCGSSGVVNVDYDNYPYLLHEEIRNRAQANNHFTENELWYLMYGLVSAANIFRQVGTKVGDIQSKSIFLNEVGQIKISNLCSWPNEHTNYEKLIFEHLPTYVSPEELEQAKEGRVDIYGASNNNNNNIKNGNGTRLDQFTCQSFSIGLTMLQAALLKLSGDLYSPKQKTMDAGALAERVAAVLRNDSKTNYSRILRMCIGGLCEVNPRKRLSAGQLYQQLRVHDSQITNLKPCKIDIDVGPNRAHYQKQIMGGNDIPVSVSAPLAANSINNYTNINGLTGTNSTQYYRTNPITHPQYNPPVTATNSYVPASQPVHFTTTNVSPYASSTGASGLNYQSRPQYNGQAYTNTYASTYGNIGTGTSDYKFQTTPPSYYIPTSTYSHNSVTNNNNDVALNMNKRSGAATWGSTLEMGSGNSYLHSIYSIDPSITSKTPTFQAINNTNNGNNNKVSIPTPNNTTPISYSTSMHPSYNFGDKTTKKTDEWRFSNLGAPVEMKHNSTYNFSNLSSIPKDQGSADKPFPPNIVAFTPSKDDQPNGKNGIAGHDSALDFLKKIDEEILKSKSKFNDQSA